MTDHERVAAIEACAGNHCWHKNGIVQTCAPPKFGFVCCHCGLVEFRRDYQEPPTGHGKYHPARRFEQSPLTPPEPTANNQGGDSLSG